MANLAPKVERYDIRIVEITAAIPQTFGSHYAFDTDILGRSLNPNVPMWNWFDVGFYDGHDITVRRIGKNIRVASRSPTASRGSSERWEPPCGSQETSR